MILERMILMYKVYVENLRPHYVDKLIAHESDMKYDLNKYENFWQTKDKELT